MKKKTKIILSILLILVIGVTLIIVLTGGNETIEETTPEGGGLPAGDKATTTETQEEGISVIKLSDDENQVFNYWEDSETGDILYISREGKIYNAKQGQDEEVSNRTITSINNIKINKEDNKVLVSFGDPNSPTWRVFNNSDRVWRPLPSYIKDITWGEDRVFAIISTQNGKSLASFDFNSLKNNEEDSYEIIIDNFSFKDVNIKYYDGDLLLIEKPSYFYESKVWKLNLETKELSNPIISKKGLMLKWSDDVVFEYNFEEDSFKILDNNFNIIQPIVFKTFPNKCVSSENNIFCFAPNNFPNIEKYDLPDDYYKEKINTVDTLYKIDRESGESNKILTRLSNNYLEGLNLKYINNKLYFKNKYNKGLYEVTFKE